MEFARLGNNELTVCPCCDKLFVWKVANDDFGTAMEALQRMFQKHLSKSPTCIEYMNALPDIDELAETLRPHFASQEAARLQRAADNPNNGTLGYWLVSGVRNEARTKASSATEAIEKCRKVVQSWESPEAQFIGTELPDVF